MTTLECPVCNGSIEQGGTYDSHTHRLSDLSGKDQYYVRYTANGKTEVKHITYTWDRLPLYNSDAMLSTKIRTILTLDGFVHMTMDRVEKLLLLK